MEKSLLGIANANFTAKTEVDKCKKQGTYVFMAQVLIAENELLIKNNDLDKVDGNITEINSLVQKERDLCKTDGIKSISLILHHLVRLLDEDDPETTQWINMANTIGKSLPEADPSDAQKELLEILQRLKFTSSDKLPAWSASILSDLKQTGKDLLERCSKLPGGHRQVAKEQISTIPGSLEEIQSAMNSQNFDLVEEKSVNLYNMFFQLERFIEGVKNDTEQPALIQKGQEILDEARKQLEDLKQRILDANAKGLDVTEHVLAIGTLEGSAQGVEPGNLGNVGAYYNDLQNKIAEIDANIKNEMQVIADKEVSENESASIDTGPQAASVDQAGSQLDDIKNKLQVLKTGVKKKPSTPEATTPEEVPTPTKEEDPQVQPESSSDPLGDIREQRAKSLLQTLEEEVLSLGDSGADTTSLTEMLQAGRDMVGAKDFNGLSKHMDKITQGLKMQKGKHLLSQIHTEIGEFSKKLNEERQKGKDISGIEAGIKELIEKAFSLEPNKFKAVERFRNLVRTRIEEFKEELEGGETDTPAQVPADETPVETDPAIDQIRESRARQMIDDVDKEIESLNEVGLDALVFKKMRTEIDTFLQNRDFETVNTRTEELFKEVKQEMGMYFLKEADKFIEDFNMKLSNLEDKGFDVTTFLERAKELGGFGLDIDPLESKKARKYYENVSSKIQEMEKEIEGG